MNDCYFCFFSVIQSINQTIQSEKAANCQGKHPTATLNQQVCIKDLTGRRILCWQNCQSIPGVFVDERLSSVYKIRANCLSSYP